MAPSNSGWRHAVSRSVLSGRRQGDCGGADKRSDSVQASVDGSDGRRLLVPESHYTDNEVITSDQRVVEANEDAEIIGTVAWSYRSLVDDPSPENNPNPTGSAS